MNLPETFVNKMKRLLGGDYENYEKCFDLPRYYGLRVNTAKISVEKFLEIAPWPLRPVPWIENGFYYDGDLYQPARHPYYFAGLYYLQEPSAMTPASRLPVEPGDRVLDVCAAPGGKATELGARLNGTGILAANDLSSSRAKGLLKNLELFGIGNVLVLCEEPGKLVPCFEEYFDNTPRYRVMGTGMDPETGMECITSYALLDADLNIIEGNLFSNRSRLTTREFGLLLGIYDPDGAGLVGLGDGDSTATELSVMEDESSEGYRISGILTENQYVINKFIGVNDAGEPRAIVFAVLILVLLIKPTGILGKPIHEKV